MEDKKTLRLKKLDISNEYFYKEALRLYESYSEYIDKAKEFCNNIDKHVDEYLYAEITPNKRGHYSTSLASHLAVGGNQKGKKPTNKKPIGHGCKMFGVDKMKRPIYIRLYVTESKLYDSYEIIFYLKDIILGITIHNDELEMIHETKYINGVVDTITSAFFEFCGDEKVNYCSVIEVEFYNFYGKNHFEWKRLQFRFGLNKNAMKDSVKQVVEDISLDIPELVEDLYYVFETNNKGKPIKMFNDDMEKVFKKTKLSTGISPIESENILGDMLKKSKLDQPSNFCFSSFLSLIDEFMRIKFDCDGDDLEYSVNYAMDYEGNEDFDVVISRLFSFNDDNDVYEYYDELFIYLYFEVTDQVRNLNDLFFTMNFDSLDSFLDEIKKSESYTVLNKYGKLMNISFEYIKTR